MMGGQREFKFHRFLVKDADTGDIAGQHVGGELDAAETAPNAARMARATWFSLHPAHLRSIITFTQQCQQRQTDLLVFAHNHLLNVAQ